MWNTKVNTKSSTPHAKLTNIRCFTGVWVQKTVNAATNLGLGLCFIQFINQSSNPMWPDSSQGKHEWSACIFRDVWTLYIQETDIVHTYTNMNACKTTVFLPAVLWWTFCLSFSVLHARLAVSLLQLTNILKSTHFVYHRCTSFSIGLTQGGSRQEQDGLSVEYSNIHYTIPSPMTQALYCLTIKQHNWLSCTMHHNINYTHASVFHVSTDTYVYAYPSFSANTGRWCGSPYILLNWLWSDTVSVCTVWPIPEEEARSETQTCTLLKFSDNCS